MRYAFLIDRRSEALALDGPPLNGTHDIQAGHDAAECRRALTIVEPHAAVVERRLIVQVNDEADRAESASLPRGIETVPTTWVRPDAPGARAEWRKSPAAARRIDVRPDDLQKRAVGQVGRVVVGSGCAMHAAAIVEAAVDVLEEVARRDRRPRDVDGEIDVAECRFDPDEDLAPGRIRLLRCRPRQHDRDEHDGSCSHLFLRFHSRVPFAGPRLPARRRGELPFARNAS